MARSSDNGSQRQLKKEEQRRVEIARQKELERLQNVEGYYSDLGVLDSIKKGDEYLYKAVDLESVKTIVEGFFAGQSEAQADDKKEVIKSLLNNPFLRVNNLANASLEYVLKRMEIEKVPDETKVKMYKAIIYISANSVNIDNKLITYTKLIGGITCGDTYTLMKKILPKISGISYLKLMYEVRNSNKSIGDTAKKGGKGGRPKKNTSPTNKTASKPMDKASQEDICSYYKKLGLLDFIKVDEKVIYSFDDLSIARQIVESGLGESIIDDVKKAVLVCILDTPLLRKNNSRKTAGLSLSGLMYKIKSMNLPEKVVYSIIISLSVHGEMLDYSYDEILDNPNDFMDKLLERLNDFAQSEVSADIFREALNKSLRKQAEIRILGDYKALGLNDFIKDKNGRLIYPESNLYMAWQIAEGFLKGKPESSDELKKGILKTILNHAQLKLNKNINFHMLADFMGIMREKGLKIEEIYGFLINLSVDPRKAGLPWSYKVICEKPEKLVGIMIARKQCEVTPETLESIRKYQGERKRRNVPKAAIGGAGLPALGDANHSVWVELKGLMEEKTSKVEDLKK